MSSHLPRIAAVVFDPREAVDEIVLDALAGYRAYHLLGWLQGYEDAGDCECSDIVVRPLHGGAARKITQDLGPESRGCRLDSSALAELAGWLAADLTAGAPDLLVINRFGKTEAEGGGLRAVLEQAIAADVPVLVPVNRKQLMFWQEYSGGMAAELACDAAAITAWVGQILPAQPCSMVNRVAAPSLV